MTDPHTSVPSTVSPTDTERLDWLNEEGRPFDLNRWFAVKDEHYNDDHRDIRDAIDAAMKENHDV